MYDSKVEREFAMGIDAREDIRFFVKLPSWFVVETPMGSYNPNWAIVKEADGRDRVCLACETKGDTDPTASWIPAALGAEPLHDPGAVALGMRAGVLDEPLVLSQNDVGLLAPAVDRAHGFVSGPSGHSGRSGRETCASLMRAR